MDEDPRRLAQRVFRGRMAPLLALGELEPEASEVFVDGDEVRLSWGDRKEAVAWTDPRLRGMRPADVRAAGSNAAVFAGVEFGPTPPALPTISVKIPPDLRVTYVCPPAADRWHVAIRFLRGRRLRLADYVARGAMSEAQRGAILALLAERRNVLVSGGTGTGKTTLLRAMLAEVESQRLLVLEDTPELNLPGAHHLRTTPNVDLAALLRTTLRLTPDRIVVGEVRGPEALELVRAMNTGHDGTLATIHSNGAEEALRRLHTLVAEAQPTFPEAGVRSAVDAVLQIAGQGKDRRLAGIWRVPR